MHRPKRKKSNYKSYSKAADIVNRHGVTLHSFADDTQLYLHCCREDITTAATRLKECIVDVGRWMSPNRLKLNTDKTELLWTGSRHSISQLHGHGPSIQLGADTVPACDHVCRLLGVIISADLSLDRHVSIVSSASLATTASTSSPITQNNLREPGMQIDCFRRTLKTCLFDQYSWHIERIT